MHTGPLAVTAVDYHTAGEPFRIVSRGVPPLRGRTVLERRRHAAEELDHFRELLVNEPRGHADMYGCHVTEPDDDGADLGVVFFHNDGYSTACGHGTIALVTWALDSGVLPLVEPSTSVVVDAPSGRLRATAAVAGGRVRSVRFANVPSYVEATGVTVDLAGGPVVVDIAFGGAFYAVLDAAAVGCEVEAADLPRLVAAGRAIKAQLERSRRVVHPEVADLNGIYGVIFVEGGPRSASAASAGTGPDQGGPRSASAASAGALRQRNVAIFADGEVDRSPTGSGVSARLALLDANGVLARGRELVTEGITGLAFSGWVTGVTELAGRQAVLTEVEGSAHRTGTHEFVLDPHDPLGTGFLLR